MQVIQLDHLVLTVVSIEKTKAFYESVLGMKPVTFGDGRIALTFGNQKINLHQMERKYKPYAANPTPGSADLCFVVEVNIEDIKAHLKNNGVKIIDGPVARTGATGPITSFYLRDPDENLIEISTYW